MSNDQAREHNQSIQKLTEYCEIAKKDSVYLNELKEDPIRVLQTLGIPVEDEFKEVVTKQLRAFADIIESQGGNEESPSLASVEPEALSAANAVPGAPTGVRIVSGKLKPTKPTQAPPAAPTGLRIVAEKARDTTPPEVLNALEFQVKAWGLVLVVREPAIKYVKGGGAITTIVLAAAAPIPIAGAILAFFAFFLGINIGVIEIMDQGKGVNITLTWAHILLCGVGLLVPAITPIK